jgi:hypothetical protein
MSPWLRAGLIGAAILVVVYVLALIPCVGFFTCFLGLLVYGGIGALAAHWLPAVRDAGAAAGQGAAAAALAAVIGGLFNIILTTVQMAFVDTSAILSQLPAESLRQLEMAGIDPAMFTGPTAGLLSGSACCLVGLFLAAILGAIGGAVYAGIKPD